MNPLIRIFVLLTFLFGSGKAFLWGGDEVLNITNTEVSLNMCSTISTCICSEENYGNRINCGHLGFPSIPGGAIIPEGYIELNFSYNNIGLLKKSTFNGSLETITTINFSFNKLTDLSEELFSDFTQLLTLDLSNNLISSVHVSAFVGLPRLHSLSLKNNKITELPISVFDPLTVLDELKLGNNPIQVLQSKIFNGLKSLEFLDLSSLQMETLDGRVFKRKKVVNLDISNNLFEEVPLKGLQDTKNFLKGLSLSGNPIRKLNETSFFGLNSLSEIHLDNMKQLEKIGAFTFQGMADLKTVTLENLPNLKTIDPKAFYLHKKGRERCGLEKLSIISTSLTTLEKGLLHWDVLNDLKLINNSWVCDCKMSWMTDSRTISVPLDEVICAKPDNLKGIDINFADPEKMECVNMPVEVKTPEIKGWSVCEELSSCNCPPLETSWILEVDCSDREFTHLLDHMYVPRVYRKLDLSQNKIKNINMESFSNEPRSGLTILDLSSNDLDVLQSSTFYRLPYLKALFLSNNKLYNLEAGSFIGLANLTVLDLHFNNIQHLPENVFDPLENLLELSLGYNKIETINGRLFASLKELKSLDLSYLQLKTLSDSLFSNQKIVKLNLDHNGLKSVPADALQPISFTLKALSLTGNPIEKLDSESFNGLFELHEIVLKQMLKLKKIGPYTFKGLSKLETISLMYLPKLKKIDKKAFHVSMAVNTTCPLRDFTLAFTAVSTLDEELMDWGHLNYLDLKNNRWTCDCKLRWIKGSIVEADVGSQIFCSEPPFRRGSNLKNMKKEELSCSPLANPQRTSVTLAVVICLLLLGILTSLATVAFLTYRRNGYVFRRPKPQFQYGPLEEDRDNVMTVVG